MPLPAALRTRLLAAVIGAFVLGVLTGAATLWLAAPSAGRWPGTHHADRHGPGPPPPHRNGPAEDMPVRLADKLSDELQADPALRESIRQVFREEFAATEPLRQRIGEEMKSHFTRQNARLRALLTLEQQLRFDSLVQEWETQHRHRPPPPPPQPQ
jgi:uncharacterized NAD(P)/FAD-binding protein YdhS